MDIVTYGALNKKVGEKLSSNQGTQNAGKMLGINNEGEIQPIQVLGGNVSVTETLESGEDYSMVIEEGEPTAVTSVAGKYGTVTLDAGDIEYDEQEVYNSGTVGKEVGDLKSQITAINAGNAALLLINDEYVERNGTITPYSSWSRTDYIPVSGVVRVYSDYSSQYCCYYASDLSFVSAVSITTGQNTLTVPNNAAYIIISNQTARMQTVRIESITASRLDSLVSLIDGMAIIQPSGVSDMKGAIESALTTYGRVQLLSGDYYVSGITMPVGSELCGVGDSTKIILLSTVTDGACINVSGDNVIRNILFTQQYGNTQKPGTATIGTLDGIRVLNDVSLCRVLSCSFYGFKRSGIYGNTVGHSSYQSIIIDDCRFMYCEIGLYFDYWTEYAVVSNSYMSQCYNGVRNDAGNNMFVGCHFDGNNSAFVMMTYNISGANDGHGSCVGCTFNHSDNYALYIRGGSHGFVFTGCHFYYGMIYLRSCTGIVFDTCQCDGSGGVTFYGGKGHRFVNVSFVATPTITEESAAQNVRFIDCYLLDGSAEVVYPTT